MRYVGETKDGDTVLCFFAAHYTPPPYYCYNAGATRRATIRTKGGAILEKDLPLCGACAKVVAKRERSLGHTVRIQKL